MLAGSQPSFKFLDVSHFWVDQRLKKIPHLAFS
uniref:Uncharacterized protein n=1 Tax=Arundo donax TaxID=35708 RepID=A0A0A9BU79_ARUDO